MNHRKEFFEVTLAQIEEVVVQCHGRVEFTRLAVAEEYRKTLTLRNEKAAKATRVEAATGQATGPESAAKVLDQLTRGFEELASS